MLSYLIFFIIFLILCFVLYIAFKGVLRGIEAKNRRKKYENNFKNKKNKWKIIIMLTLFFFHQYLLFFLLVEKRKVNEVYSKKSLSRIFSHKNKNLDLKDDLLAIYKYHPLILLIV